MRLAYKAYEKSGREVTDVIDAPSVAEATDRLRQRDLFVADIAPAGSAELARPGPSRARRRRRPRTPSRAARPWAFRAARRPSSKT